MVLVLLAPRVGDRRSGQSRFICNLAVGLRAAGDEVVVTCLRIDPAVKDHLLSQRVRVVEGTGRLSSARLDLASVTMDTGPARTLASLAARVAGDSIKVILADEGLQCARYLPGHDTCLLSQGDMALLYLRPEFYKQQLFLRGLLSTQSAGMIVANGRAAARCRIRLANSEFTRSLMSFLYGLPFEGVVYPPVDTDYFSIGSAPHSEPYLLYLGRGSGEQGTRVLEKIGKATTLKVVGGARVVGATNLGIVSDEELRELYRGAAALLAPSVSEQFGYAIAEAAACGTPSVAYRACGPGEQIRDGITGWLADSTDSFIRLALNAMAPRSECNDRQTIRAAALRFSIPTSVKSLQDHLKSISPGVKSDGYTSS